MIKDEIWLSSYTEDITASHKNTVSFSIYGKTDKIQTDTANLKGYSFLG